MSDPKLASNVLVSVAALHAADVSNYEQRLQNDDAVLRMMNEQLKGYHALYAAARALVDLVETPIDASLDVSNTVKAFGKRITETYDLAKVIKECLSPSGSSGAPTTPPT